MEEESWARRAGQGSPCVSGGHPGDMLRSFDRELGPERRDALGSEQCCSPGSAAIGLGSIGLRRGSGRLGTDVLR